jgi:hypothetical protein
MSETHIKEERERAAGAPSGLDGDVERTEEVWYEIEYASKGTDDWYASEYKADTEERLYKQMREMTRVDFDYRPVRVTVIREVL